MSEPITEPQPVDHAAVAQQLQTVVTELRGKNAQRKTRIAELEAAMTAKDSEISQLQTTVRQVTIDGPLKAMAEHVGTVPDLWLQEFQKTMTVALADGKLMVHDTEGKPIMAADGKPLPFEAQAITKHLIDEKHPQAKTFRAITVGSRASGAATIGTQRRTASSEEPKRIQFGLR
jgi:hypothetical protein